MTFAALNNGRRCMCRNSPGQQLHDRNCNVKCSGDQTQTCGGNTNSTFYSLYTVCQFGYYGNKCGQVCHCRRQAPCNRVTGQCPNGCEAKWFGTTCNNAGLSEYRPIGCFRDNANRAISPEYHYSEQMTVQSCTESCILRNNSIAGLQGGGHCFCGESYAKYGPRRESDCSDPCPGNPSQKCGGAWANSVYSVCPVGFYGRNCVNQCHCSGGDSCLFNGSCLSSMLGLCKRGWTGSACHTRDCGINNGDCESDEKCETVDLSFGNVSACRCKDGFYRDGYTCIPSHLHYVGCYNGTTSQYVAVEPPTSDALTIEFCILKCKQLNKKYSLIQGGITCLCGDDYGQAIPDAECKVPCAGSTRKYCGGNSTVNGTPIYTVYTASFFRQYIGCYKDQISAAMEKKFSWQYGRNNTIESCGRHCASLNVSYAGVQYGYDCFCGNSYDKYGPLTESSCNMSCHGNSSQMCGGRYANSVYAVNDIPRCSRHLDCTSNEVCNVIDLKYASVSRCRCKQGFYRRRKWSFCTDGDECKSDESKCNQTSENCVNTIGSYICVCKVGFVNISGQCKDIDECRNNSPVCNIGLELCQNTIGSYLCHCKSGYEDTTFGKCTDIDECHLVNNTSSPCNAFSECVNSIGSYMCRCKENFVCGKGDSADTTSQHFVCDKSEDCSSSHTFGIVLGTVLAISLLINIFFVVFRINKVKSTKPESGESKAQSDLQHSSKLVSDQNENQHKNDYDVPSEPIEDDNVYEQIVLEERPAVVNKPSEYAALKQDG